MGDVKVTFNEACWIAFEYNALLLNACSNRPHLGTTAGFEAAAAFGITADATTRQAAASRHQMKEMFRIM
jgi:hypothetical protein